ncbi:MAG: hypothetical protein N4Q30_06035 [Neisseriaceae bacterium]|nr:hypothetical protein [Neisseriaceae bacterium]
MKKLSLLALLALFSTAVFAEDAPEEDAPRAAGGVIPVPVVQNSADFNVAVDLANGFLS